MPIPFRAIEDQAKLLRAGDVARVDVGLVAEALEAYVRKSTADLQLICQEMLVGLCGPHRLDIPTIERLCRLRDDFKKKSGRFSDQMLEEVSFAAWIEARGEIALMGVDRESIDEACPISHAQLVDQYYFGGDRSRTESVGLNAKDYFLWANQQARLLMSKQFEKLDLEYLVDEISDLFRREKLNLYSAVKKMLYTLIMLKEAPGAETLTEWRSELSLQRSDIESIIEDSPSLETELQSMIEKGWVFSRKMATHELLSLGIDAAFPDDCPWTIEQILHDDFLPATQ